MNSLAEMLAEIMGCDCEDSEPHYHGCPGCGEVWSHRAADFKTQEEHTRGHTCPKGCARQYSKCDAQGRLL